MSKLANCSQNFSQLDAWLRSAGDWVGKIYVAHTISWNKSDFLQRGCSPNFNAGWWSLACCKYDMRSSKKFKNALGNLRSNQNSPVFIFTLASRYENPPKGSQALVSVAMVTEYFPDMDAYAKRVIADPNLRDSRLSRIFPPSASVTPGSCYSWIFGDCHADLAGTVNKPHPHHVHVRKNSNAWQKDINGRHNLLLSNKFLIWSQPLIFSIRTLGRSRYGHDIDPSNLNALLC